jgi:hypothetical protein
MKLFVAAAVLGPILATSMNKVGKPKSVTTKIVLMNEINYTLSENTLPLHFFSEFDKDDITERMDCFINYRAENCIEFCDTRFHHNINETFQCYKLYRVPNSYYGKVQCDNLYPDITRANAESYISCLNENQVNYT